VLSKNKVNEDTGDIAENVRIVRSSHLFDAKWYLWNYPDVALTGVDPAEHYVRYGVRMGRNPGPKFDTNRYLRENPQLFASRDNPLVHYLCESSKGRRGMPLRPSTPNERKGAHFRGFLDHLDERGVAGWAIDESRPGRPVELSVFVDGEHLIDFDTNIHRPDLIKRGLHGEHAGFVYHWPASLFRKGSTVDVRFKKNGWSISKSPRVIAQGPATAPVEFSQTLDAFLEQRIRPVSVIIPIFNAYEAVVECIESVYRHTPSHADILLIDDASTDSRIAEFLGSLLRRPRTRVISNPENLGYTRTINKAIADCSGRDVVLLNSDTIVTERWLDALRYGAYARPRVATVTALSNNAGAFSVPRLGVCNPCPDHLDPVQFGRVVAGSTRGRLLEVPTGNGFCMYITRSALDAIGLFDEQKYPRGYGEENDFCMRALHRGWKNIVSDKSFVLHKRSQSFKEEKEKLAIAGGERLSVDYPEYGMLIARFSDAEFAAMRAQIASALGKVGASTLPRILFVISTQTGGTPQTNLDLMRTMRGIYHCWLLRCDSQTVTLSELVGDSLIVRETHSLGQWVEPITHRSEEYDQVVASIMYRYSISLLHIRHVAWHGLNLAVIAKSQNIPIVYSFHDFYSVCPSLNLLDNDLKFCGGVCTASEGDCQAALWPSGRLPTLKHRYVKRWQQMFSEFLSACDAFITTAPSVAKTIADVYPRLEGRITVIPHGRDFPPSEMQSEFPPVEGAIRVLVPGNIGPAKGSELIRRLAEIDVSGKYELHFLGAADGLKDIGVHHGQYQREDFAKKAMEIAPAFGVVLSVCAETYCHTLTEMWSCGIPVLGTDIGAVGDRIRTCEGGWLIQPEASPEEVLARMDQIVSDRQDYKNRLAAVAQWQATEAKWNDTTTMSLRYRQVYSGLLRRDLEESDGKRLGLLYRQRPSTPATAFIRVIQPWSAALETSQHEARVVETDWLLAGGARHVDGLLIQRNAVPDEQIHDLLSCLSRLQVPYIYEIDDPLWDLPGDHPEKHAYASQEQSIVSLIEGAALVTTSTAELCERLKAMNPSVFVIPNALDQGLWCAPLEEGHVAQILADCDIERNGRPKILYMGTASHREDVEMIAPMMQAVLDVRPEVELIQIGGGVPLPGARMIPVPASYASYPEFVIWFRAICSTCGLALAPLRDTPFNQMKSEIKVLDYAFGGLPAVYSAVGPYKRNVSHRRTGLLVDNNLASWVRSIHELLDDSELRETIRRQAYDWAKTRSSHTSGLQLQALQQAFGWHLNGWRLN
jgi:GT2 family glycosyltransferase/glycosyltransferase involved in cell wall biosynthesis